jgi:hypothetical protein
MEDHLNIQYILFSYVGPSEIESDRMAVALTLHSLGEAGTGKLTVYARPNWDNEYQPGDQLELAKETLIDWEQVSPADAPAVFQDLLDASWGPFRAMAHGTCTPSDFERVLTQKLLVGC